jgi:nucleotide-binding universal stress UspA family protein
MILERPDSQRGRELVARGGALRALGEDTTWSEMSSPSPQEVRGSTAETRSAEPFARVLVPIDFSSAARAAFKAALQIADRWGSEVILFNAPGEDENDEFMNATGVVWGTDDIIQDAREHLHSFADTVVPGSLARVTIDVDRDDDPVRAVVNACARHAASLVVLGVHPRVRRRLMRSHHERIVHRLTCAVLLVPGEVEAPVDASV